MEKQQKIVKTNIYRCEEYCPNCPFLDMGKKLFLDPGRVPALIEMLISEQDSSFNCHKTVYDLDNDMNSTSPQQLKMCYGAWLIKRNHGVLNIQMRLAISLGIDLPLKEQK